MAWRTSKTKEAVLDVFENLDEIVVFDTETTGFKAENPNGEPDRIIQFSGIKFRINNWSLEKIDELNLYINPERSLPPKIVELTGITDEMLINADTESEAFAKIYEFMQYTHAVAAYNAPFDIRFLNAMYMRQMGQTTEFDFILDVLEMARDIVPKTDSKRHKLGDIASLYGADAGLTFHNSMDDTTATARLLSIFCDKYREQNAAQEEYPKKKAKIYRLGFWLGYRGQSRIYIHTNIGSFYYDIRSKTWNADKSNPYTTDEVDMENLRIEAFKMANVDNELDFAKYR